MAYSRVGKTPRKGGQSDPLQVYCRIRPILMIEEQSCINVVSDTTVQLTPPDGCNPRYFNNKEVQYVFKKVFDADVAQEQVYKEVAHPLVDNLIHGKNGLLLTYGVTSSGKTYTMTGSNTDGGIMVRSIDVLFNSIGRYQPNKRTFKPDKMNGFDVQSQPDALLQRQTEINDLARRTPGGGLKRNKSDPEMESRVKEISKVDNIDEDNVYSVFVSYIEIYNNSVHDLLEDVPEVLSGNGRIQLTSRGIREDGDKNMYVLGVNEIEVTSPEEAIQVFYKGLARKQMAKTSCNKESSRSHSVFIIRLVQAPLDLEGETPLQDKRAMVVSQLSLVDLAGSERSSRTQVTSGQRLREAGNINNSLMTLRYCLEILRENQLQGTNKIPPFRESKLTHLFKAYFTGEGDVRMIVCVNPREEDYDENLAVMKFAEMSQEVQISKPLPARLDFGLTPGRRKINEATKKMREIIKTNEIPPPVDIIFSLPPFPSFDSRKISDDRRQLDLLIFLESRHKKEKEMATSLKCRVAEFRNGVIDTLATNRTIAAERDHLKNRLASATQQAVEADQRATSLAMQLENEVRTREHMEKELERRGMNVERLRLMKEKAEEKAKVTKTKLNQKLQTKMQEQAETFEKKLRHNEKKVIRNVKNLIDSQLPDTSSLSSDSELCGPVSTQRSTDYSTTRTTRSSRAREVAMATPNVTTRRLHSQFNALLLDLPIVPEKLESTRRSRSCGASGSDSCSTPRVIKPVPLQAPLAPANASAQRVMRPRRSRSADTRGGGTWLHHAPGQVLRDTPYGTVFQPTGWKKRKSVTALTDMKDIVDPKLAKYSLMTQQATSDGEMETHLFKADVLPTTTGGVNVVFNDVETLKQTSPCSSPVKHRIAVFNALSTENLENKCQTGIEGHPASRRK